MELAACRNIRRLEVELGASGIEAGCSIGLVRSHAASKRSFQEFLGPPFQAFDRCGLFWKDHIRSCRQVRADLFLQK